MSTSVQRSKSSRDATQIIVGNPTRRSRAERTMALVSMGSYPHYLIGNTSNIINGGNERAAKAALAAENKLGLLDFIRSFSLELKQGNLAFYAHGISLDAEVNNINLVQADSTCYPMATCVSGDDQAASNLASASGLIKQMVECFHRTQVRGMTRKFDIHSPYWHLVKRKLVLSKDKPQLKALGKEETREAINFEQAIQCVIDTLQLPEYKVVFGTGSIALTHGDTTSEILFELPPRN